MATLLFLYQIPRVLLVHDPDFWLNAFPLLKSTQYWAYSLADGSGDLVVLGGHELDQIDDSVGVTVLIVIPKWMALIN